MTDDHARPAPTFARLLREGRPAVALEITPPQRFLPSVLLRRAGLLGNGAQAINVIQRPERMSSLDASLFLRSRGFEPTWHFVARGHTRESAEADLDRAAAGGINQVLCIMGDQAARADDHAPSVRALVRMARERLPDALVGATFNQCGSPTDRAYANLFGKIDAGATFVQTQPVFDTHAFFMAADRIQREYRHVAMVPMVMPLLDVSALRRIQGRLGVTVPDGFRSAVEAGHGAAWEAFDRLLEELTGSPGVQGLAVMTYEMDPPAGTGRRLLEALKRCGAAPGEDADGDTTSR